MGNKNSSTHLTNHHKSNYYLTNHDKFNYHIDTSSYRNSTNKKHGPSPRFRRRHPNKKIKRPQV